MEHLLTKTKRKKILPSNHHKKNKRARIQPGEDCVKIPAKTDVIVVHLGATQKSSVCFYGRGILHSHFGTPPDSDVVKIHYNYTAQKTFVFVPCPYKSTELARGSYFLYESLPGDCCDAEDVEAHHPSELFFSIQVFDPKYDAWAAIVTTEGGNQGGLGLFGLVLPYWFGNVGDHIYDYTIELDPMRGNECGVEWKECNAMQLARLSLLRVGINEGEDPHIM